VNFGPLGPWTTTQPDCQVAKQWVFQQGDDGLMYKKQSILVVQALALEAMKKALRRR